MNPLAVAVVVAVGLFSLALTPRQAPKIVPLPDGPCGATFQWASHTCVNWCR